MGVRTAWDRLPPATIQSPPRNYPVPPCRSQIPPRHSSIQHGSSFRLASTRTYCLVRRHIHRFRTYLTTQIPAYVSGATSFLARPRVP